MVESGGVPQFGPWRGLGDEELLAALPKLGKYPIAGLVRRARRLSDLSQRQLARLVGVAPSTVGRIEAGATTPSLALLQRLLSAAGLMLVVVDAQGRLVLPMGESDDVRDGAQRRYPSHLDTILDPREGEWWADTYGLARPPETFFRDRRYREAARRRARWWARVSERRGKPEPRNPYPAPQVRLRPAGNRSTDQPPPFDTDDWD